ncbi:porin [Pseudomonas nitroreducens]|uniref:outer membrane beta-barrel protein n=1 Tax=Pseudomonas nitroreducens TaxID=46680 RepID=UPI0014732A3B|nr:outer membrane beta-barrel protein [Pseudomonas nitroreducens]MDG9856913.1 porin [Pseudomonas nitroreducens]MDH1075828.1 porin [Pseudomonas nitroreducens]NMZ76439.1 outer membrane beta-barrel protein [Pseudomonas nitroreducens]
MNLRPLLFCTSLLAPLSVVPLAGNAADGPIGSLARNLFGPQLEDDYGIRVGGWAQAGLMYNDNGSRDVAGQGFFNSREGFNLNQFALAVERQPGSNVIGRVGPFPGTMPQEADWGFNVTALYGKDARFFKTYGWDEDLGVNRAAGPEDENFNIAQAYLDFYFPVLGGSDLMLGIFHTPLENEIGFPLPTPAPADFYTHTYSFMHGPAKHAGALYSFKLPSAKDESMLGFELGLVQGWNNLQSENHDPHLIANLRWRSADFRTWVDWENIYGNGADDSFAECACGSPIPTTGNAHDRQMRYETYLTVSHALNGDNRLALETGWGRQKDAALAGFAGKQDGTWYGSNLNWYHRLGEKLMWNSRAEWFYTDAPVHVVMAYIDPATGIPDPSWGSFYGFTTNLVYTPVANVRLRPELRYDIHDGDGRKAYGDGRSERQLLTSVDVTFYF